MAEAKKSGPTASDLLFGLGAVAADRFARWEQQHQEELADFAERGKQAVRSLAQQTADSAREMGQAVVKRLRRP